METMTYTEAPAAKDFVKFGRTRSGQHERPSERPIPEGFMSLEQFERELTEAVMKKI